MSEEWNAGHFSGVSQLGVKSSNFACVVLVYHLVRFDLYPMQTDIDYHFMRMSRLARATCPITWLIDLDRFHRDKQFTF
jgi:hypothetical protein